LDILKLLVAVPDSFRLKQLFDDSDSDATYSFKGMINFQMAHYLAYFRRTMPAETTAKDYQYRKEIEESEWT
jgi:uncharacterized protein YfbU (UPF0304 family)